MQYKFQDNPLSVDREANANPLKPFKPRAGRKLKAESQIIDSDPAIQRYYTHLKSRKGNAGYLSPQSQSNARTAVRQFLEHLQTPITNHAVTDLVKQKLANPQNFTLDDKIEEYSNLEPLKAHRNRANNLIGIFKANRCNIVAKSDSHLASPQTKFISDGIIKAIYKDLPAEHQLLMSMQAHSGQRIAAISKLTFDKWDMTTSDKYALLNIPQIANKSRIAHPTIIPKPLAQEIIKHATQAQRRSAFPNSESLWRDITKLAAEKYGVRLISHYLRKRFQTIASDTQMNPNEWCLLMGAMPTKGHLPEIYSLNDLNKIIQDYDTHLSNALALDKNQTKETHQEPPLKNNPNTDIQTAILQELREIKNLLSGTATPSPAPLL
ncbi:MAG: hypothetical protein HYU39_01825 [Thaumarchaeota archaeon]|nr:hypothetical protein [Nitrososphaerota archaeon]